MPDRCGLMLHKELDGLLRANSGVASVREFNSEGGLVENSRMASPFSVDNKAAGVVCHCHCSFVFCRLLIIPQNLKKKQQRRKLVTYD